MFRMIFFKLESRNIITTLSGEALRGLWLGAACRKVHYYLFCGA
jgi:hypothetical protein